MSLFVTDDPDAWRQATYACNGINGKILDAVSEVAGQGLQLSSARKGWAQVAVQPQWNITWTIF